MTPGTLTDIPVAIIGAVAVVLGALIAFVATILTIRFNAASARESISRESLEALQKIFLNYQLFVQGSHSVIKAEGTTLEDVLEEEWARVAGKAHRRVEQVAGRRARKALRTALEVLSRAQSLHRNGLGTAKTPRQEAWLAAGDGFSVVSALLRKSALPLRATRRFRVLRRELRFLYIQLDELDALNSGETRPATGLLRRAWRAIRLRRVRLLKRVSKPFRRAWSFLFSP